MALKSGHSSEFSRLPSDGTENTRAQNSAPKKAAKNITSEKMNQPMLQRKETSMRSLYRPPSLADGVAEPLEQHEQPTARPPKSEYMPQPWPLIQAGRRRG
jgi:hypothetical protein